jgi:hypothetical protein
MIRVVKCVGKNCTRVLFEVTADFAGGVIVKCRRCGNYLLVNSATDVGILEQYEPQGSIVFHLEPTCDPSVQPEKNKEG